MARQLWKILPFFGFLLITLFAVSRSYAATPPDSCFSFNSGTGTITDYFDYEGNNNSNPACPRAVDIPATIGGTAVTIIGDNAFYENQLTAVTIPNSVTTLNHYAFAYNQLTAITIPNSVTTLDYYAFAYNQLTAITIPNSVTIIDRNVFMGNRIVEVAISASVTRFGGDSIMIQAKPDGTSFVDLIASNYDIQVGQAFLGSIIYTNIYASPSQVMTLNLTDSVMFESSIGLDDFNADGDQTDVISGHLINPAHITATYKDNNGNTIAPSTTATGTGLSTYLAVDNPTNNLGLYYKAGNSYTVPTAPTIAGYEIVTTPSNIASLSAGNNPITYVYKATSNNNGGNDSDDNNNSNVGSTANLTTPSSPISAFSLRPVSISTPTGTNISSSSTVPESSLSTQDPNNQYPLGLVNFSFTTNQSSNQVTLDYTTNLKPNQVQARKYNPTTNSYTNLPTNANVTITESTINGKHHLVLTYTIIDNGELDLNPTSGTISDPVGLAVSNSTYDQLASTGENMLVWILASLGLLGICGLAVYRLNKSGAIK